METYYQESGRAGRDGLPSECLLYFRPADAQRQSSMVFYENCGLENLYGIVRYCQLCSDLKFILSKFLDSSSDSFWKAGWIYTRVRHRVAFAYDGQLLLDIILNVSGIL